MKNKDFISTAELAEILGISRVAEAIKDALIEAAKSGLVDEIIKIKKEFDTSDEILKTDEVQVAAKIGLKKLEEQYGSSSGYQIKEFKKLLKLKYGE